LGAALGVCGVVVVLFLKELPLRKSYAPTSEAPTDTTAQVGHDAFPSLPPVRPDGQPPARPPREKGLVA
jgi:hypothetical protein